MKPFIICLAMLSLFVSQANATPIGGRSLPKWCQNGHCVIQTIEWGRPILFDKKGTLFKAGIEELTFETSRPKNKMRESSISYVFCSKEFPAVIEAHGQVKFLVGFLAPNDSQTYYHANETQLAIYFAVCHGRIFNSMLGDVFDDIPNSAPAFASKLGYRVLSRDDQPTISNPTKIVELISRSSK